ncbi:2-succinyl-6-hydroxy-2,4-cyclohexadiene-1-carboxylate synthase [Priestia megaterium]
MRYQLSGVSYYVHTEGKGEPLLLLHGFTGSSQTWRTFMKKFAKDYQVIAVDIIGHGQSAAPKEIKPYSMEAVVEALHDLLQQLSLSQINVIGYSMGGRLALSFAQRYPHLVKKLVLESASPGLKTQEEQNLRKEKDEQLASRIMENGIEEFVNYWEEIPLFRSQKQLPRHVQEAVRKERLSHTEIGLSNSLKGMGTGVQPSLWEMLGDLLMPVLLITGEVDQKFCLISKEMQTLIPNATSKIILGTGHAIHVEQPEIFGRIVSEFLATT